MIHNIFGGKVRIGVLYMCAVYGYSHVCIFLTWNRSNMHTFTSCLLLVQSLYLSLAIFLLLPFHVAQMCNSVQLWKISSIIFFLMLEYYLCMHFLSFHLFVFGAAVMRGCTITRRQVVSKSHVVWRCMGGLWWLLNVII